MRERILLSDDELKELYVLRSKGKSYKKIVSFFNNKYSDSVIRRVCKELFLSRGEEVPKARVESKGTFRIDLPMETIDELHKREKTYLEIAEELQKFNIYVSPETIRIRYNKYLKTRNRTAPVLREPKPVLSDEEELEIYPIIYQLRENRRNFAEITKELIDMKYDITSRDVSAIYNKYTTRSDNTTDEETTDLSEEKREELYELIFYLKNEKRLSYSRMMPILIKKGFNIDLSDISAIYKKMCETKGEKPKTSLHNNNISDGKLDEMITADMKLEEVLALRLPGTSKSKKML